MSEQLFRAAPFVALTQYLRLHRTVVMSRERKLHVNACLRTIDKLGSDFVTFEARVGRDPELVEALTSAVQAWREDTKPGLRLVNVHGMLRNIRNRIGKNRAEGEEDAIARFTEAIRGYGEQLAQYETQAAQAHL